MSEKQATATAIAIASQLPDWNLIDEISIPLLETGVATLPVLQAALPTILSIDTADEKIEKNFKKVFRIAQLEIQHLLRTQQEILNHMVKLEADQQKSGQSTENSEKSEKNDSFEEKMAKFKCSECGKIFLNEIFLTSHFERRHSTKKVQHSNSELIF